MKVLFVVKSKSIETLGVMYLAAVVKQCGHDARIWDIDYANKIKNEYREYDPDIVGFSIMTGDRHKFQGLRLWLLSHYKSTTKTPTFIVGGHDPSLFPQGYEWADMIISGEAEQTLAELLGSHIKYPNLDNIPWPDRSDFPNMKIRDFIASRGCSWGVCGYCYNSAWNRLFPELKKVRHRSVNDVVKEIVSVNPQFAYFQDSTFAPNIKWMREFSRQYRSVRIPYHVHLRPNMVNEERVLLLHDSNCVSCKIALETGSDSLRKLINRGNTNNEDAINASKLFRKWDIALIMQNILALPSSTIEDDLETLEINIRCKPAYAWSSIFQPYPATDLAIYCEKNGLYSGDYSEIGDNFFDKSVLNISEEHKEQVVALQRIFAFCTEHQVMPKVEDLTLANIPNFINKTMRGIGDKRMFPGVQL